MLRERELRDWRTSLTHYDAMEDHSGPSRSRTVKRKADTIASDDESGYNTTSASRPLKCRAIDSPALRPRGGGGMSLRGRGTGANALARNSSALPDTNATESLARNSTTTDVPSARAASSLKLLSDSTSQLASSSSRLLASSSRLAAPFLHSSLSPPQTSTAPQPRLSIPSVRMPPSPPTRQLHSSYSLSSPESSTVPHPRLSVPSVRMPPAPAPPSTRPSLFSTGSQAKITKLERELAQCRADLAAEIKLKEDALRSKDAVFEKYRMLCEERDIDRGARDQTIALLDRTSSERDRAVAERDVVVAERDAAAAERDAVVAERETAIAQAAAERAARNEVIVELDETAAERNTAVSRSEELAAERDGMVAQRDAALVERDAARAGWNATADDLDTTIDERDIALEERDAVIAERNEVIAERDSAITGRDMAIAERDAIINERDAASTKLRSSKAAEKPFEDWHDEYEQPQEEVNPHSHVDVLATTHEPQEGEDDDDDAAVQEDMRDTHEDEEREEREEAAAEDDEEPADDMDVTIPDPYAPQENDQFDNIDRLLFEVNQDNEEPADDMDIAIADPYALQDDIQPYDNIDEITSSDPVSGYPSPELSVAPALMPKEEENHDSLLARLLAEDEDSKHRVQQQIQQADVDTAPQFTHMAVAMPMPIPGPGPSDGPPVFSLALRRRLQCPTPSRRPQPALPAGMFILKKPAAQKLVIPKEKIPRHTAVVPAANDDQLVAGPRTHDQTLPPPPPPPAPPPICTRPPILARPPNNNPPPTIIGHPSPPVTTDPAEVELLERLRADKLARVQELKQANARDEAYSRERARCLTRDLAWRWRSGRNDPPALDRYLAVLREFSLRILAGDFRAGDAPVSLLSVPWPTFAHHATMAPGDVTGELADGFYMCVWATRGVRENVKHLQNAMWVFSDEAWRGGGSLGEGVLWTVPEEKENREDFEVMRVVARDAVKRSWDRYLANADRYSEDEDIEYIDDDF